MIILIFALQRFYPRATLYERVCGEGGEGGKRGDISIASVNLDYIHLA